MLHPIGGDNTITAAAAGQGARYFRNVVSEHNANLRMLITSMK